MGLSLVGRGNRYKQRRSPLAPHFATMSVLSRVFYYGYTHSRPAPVHLRDFLTPSRIAVQMLATGKEHVLSQLVALAAPNPAVHDAILEELRAREAAFPTALGDGVALPHVRTAHVETVHLAAAVLAKPLPFGAADGNAVDVFFLVLSPKSAPSEHLRVLRSLSRLVSESRTVSALRAAQSVTAFLATVDSVAPF